MTRLTAVAGFDVVRIYDVSTPIVVNLGQGTIEGSGIGTISVVSVQGVSTSTGDDTLIGSGGEETLSGGGGNDTLQGDGGYDILKGEEGNDHYIYNLGDGGDDIDENGSASDEDWLIFGAGINPEDVMISRMDNDLWLHIGSDDPDVIWIIDGVTGADDAIEEIHFANGVIWTDEFMREQLIAAQITSGDDDIWGTGFDDLVDAGAGNDEIGADDGDDILRGGAGDDLINGGGGADRFVYAAGDGSDDIEDYGEDGEDTLELTDLNLADISLWRHGSALLIAVYATGEVISVDWQFNSEFGTYGLEFISFSDGTVWDRDDIEAGAIEVQDEIWGTSGNDTLSGDIGDNYIFALEGDDIISAAFGDDIVYADDGNDQVEGGAGDDELDGGEGTDVISYATATSGITINLASSFRQETGGAGNDRVSGFENVIGSAYSDEIRGDGGANTIAGLAGADTFAFDGVFGSDIIDDFSTSEDRLEFVETIFADVNAVLAAAAQVGSDVVIDAGSFGSITLQGVLLSTLTASNLIIVPEPRNAPDILKAQETENTKSRHSANYRGGILRS